MALFRAGHEDAFSIIHDRYRQRLFAYTRQMLPGSRQDAEDALQDVFVRAYGGLRVSDRQLALRAWLYRVAHNRCIDELRRPPLPAPELADMMRPPIQDPIAIAEQRDTLRRLIDDVRRLPEQQRSALLMRELSDMSYNELSSALDVSVPAVKSLLVRARVGLAKAAEARDTSCVMIRDELSLAHDRGVRPNSVARRHLKDCPGCREFRRDVRGLSRQFALLTPALGPIGVIAKLLGLGGVGGGSGAAAGSGAIAGGSAVAGGGAIGAGGMLAGGAATHVATLLAAAVVAAGGAVELQQSMSTPAHHRHVVHVAARQPAAPTAPPTSSVARPAEIARPVVAKTAAAAPASGKRTASTPAHPESSAPTGALSGVTRQSVADPGASSEVASNASNLSMTVPYSVYADLNGVSGSGGTGSASAPTGTGSSNSNPSSTTIGTDDNGTLGTPTGTGSDNGTGSGTDGSSTGSGGTTSGSGGSTSTGGSGTGLGTGGASSSSTIG